MTKPQPGQHQFNGKVGALRRIIDFGFFYRIGSRKYAPYSTVSAKIRQ